MKKFFSQNSAGGDYRTHRDAQSAALRADLLGHFGESGVVAEYRTDDLEKELEAAQEQVSELAD